MDAENTIINENLKGEVLLLSLVNGPLIAQFNDFEDHEHASILSISLVFWSSDNRICPISLFLSLSAKLSRTPPNDSKISGKHRVSRLKAGPPNQIRYK